MGTSIYFFYLRVKVRKVGTVIYSYISVSDYINLEVVTVDHIALTDQCGYHRDSNNGGPSRKPFYLEKHVYT